jgi:hypothetical protein
MNSLCWEGLGKSIDHDAAVRAVGAALILFGLWVLSLVIVAFALPILLAVKIRKAVRRRQPEAAVQVSKLAHP